jgi:putative sterol carrier protein
MLRTQSKQGSKRMDLAEVASGMAARFGGAAPLGGTVKFDLGSDGSLYIDGTGAANTVTVNKADAADCTIEMSASDFGDLISGNLGPTAAFMQGKMRVEGNTGLVMKLGQLV